MHPAALALALADIEAREEHLGGLGAAASTTSAANTAASEATRQTRSQTQDSDTVQSNVSVEVSFGESEERTGTEDEQKRRKPAQN